MLQFSEPLHKYLEVKAAASKADDACSLCTSAVLGCAEGQMLLAKALCALPLSTTKDKARCAPLQLSLSSIISQVHR
jgi:hypothetical protein